MQSRQLEATIAVGRTKACCLASCSKVQGLSNGELGRVVVVLVHIATGPPHHKLIQPIPIVRDVPCDLHIKESLDGETSGGQKLHSCEKAGTSKRIDGNMSMQEILYHTFC